MLSPAKSCPSCHRVAADMAPAIGLCPSCCHGNSPAARLRAQTAHRDSRAAFDLPVTPPRDTGGIRCVLCANECVIGEGSRGYCGLRTVHKGRLIHLAGTPERVFGLADQASRRAIIALPRLRQTYYGLSEDTKLFQQRVLKEAVHELGHVFGLSHCTDRRCVMAFSNSLADTDFKSHEFCSKCRRQFLR